MRAAVVLIVCGAVAAWLLGRPVPQSLLDDSHLRSVVWLDRSGERLSVENSALGGLREPILLEQMAPALVSAVVAAEDARFFEHPGIEVRALLRALLQNSRHGGVVSGGSTLTQQLARLLLNEDALKRGAPLPKRTLWRKVLEAQLALRLERQLGKRAILTHYLNRAPLGHLAYGVEAAAQRYFGVGAGALTTAQSALLVGMLKGPSYYDPLQHPERAALRQRYVLRRMRETGALTPAQEATALAEDVHPSLQALPHDGVHAISTARADGFDAGGTRRLSLEASLQRDVEAIVQEEVPRYYSRGARSAAVVVIDNPSGEVRALVGAAFPDNPRWGQFNAATAVRQPGSTLKPFLYAAALTRGESAASIAADIEQPFPDTWGIYQPENYDRRYHGPVRYREALAQSLNVAAVDVLRRTGLDNAYGLLDDLQLTTLDRRPSFFGLGMALGSGGVRLIDLAYAYSALANGGIYRRRALSGGQLREHRVMSAQVAYIISDILADKTARVPQFGERSVLNTPYWAAVKTGTSKGFHDNWTLGFTLAWTVGVWVGDPQGEPMIHVSGVDGAGGIWRRVMNRLNVDLRRVPALPDTVDHAEVCTLSGLLVGPHCDGTIRELFVKGHEPTAVCAWHQSRHGNARSTLPAQFAAWAHAEGMRGSGDGDDDGGARSVRLVSPAPREAVHLDPDVPRAQQALPLHVEASPGESVTFMIDGQPFAVSEAAPHVVYWPVQLGRHQFWAVTTMGEASAMHEVVVR